MAENVFQAGLRELKNYLKELYKGIDDVISLVNKNSPGYDNLYKAHGEYKSGINKLISGLKKASDAVIIKEGINIDALEGLKQNSYTLYQLFAPNGPARNLIAAYTSEKIFGEKALDISLFERGMGIMVKYYIGPIRQIEIAIAQRQRKPVRNA